MALVQCPKCKAEIVDASTRCPVCQTPIDLNRALLSPTAVRPPSQPMAFFPTFFAILFEPRQVFGRVLAGAKGESTWAMIVLLSLLGFLNDAIGEHKVLTNLLLIPVVMGITWLAWKFIAWVNTHLGKWLGGTGTFPELFEWAVWGGTMLCLGDAIHILSSLDISDGWHDFWRVVWWGESILGIIFSLILLSVAHRFSIWKALALVLINLAMIFIPLTVLLHLGNMNWTQIFADVWNKG